MIRKGAVAAISLVVFLNTFAVAALANFAVHTSYMADTDACAGCHRAHTANSPLTWTDNAGGTRNALLLTANGAADARMTSFCYSCHGSNAPGASTDVQSGVFDSSSSTLTENGLGPLNGGGFEQIGTVATTSYHVLDGAWTMSGSSSDTGGPFAMQFTLTCTECHNSHGSSNYRILNDRVNGHIVGGYIAGNGDELVNQHGVPIEDADPTPDPWVVSAELGYPDGTGANGTPDLGFRLHKIYWPVNGSIPPAYDGATPSLAYQPNYTTARYAQPVGTNPMKGISGWCIACHEQYMTKAGAIAVDVTATTSWISATLPSTRTFGASDASTPYDAGDGAGFVVRHRHPMNVPLTNFYIGGNPANGPVGDRALIYNPGKWQSDVSGDVKAIDIPLEHAITEGLASAGISSASIAETVTGGGVAIRVLKNTLTDYIGCLTCHRAHGTTVTMKGYSNVNSFLGAPDSNPVGTQGVPPNKRSSLLRADNRGVCERCHNK